MLSIKKLFLILPLLFASYALSAEPIDINTANAQTIAQIMVGVGAAKAHAIVAYRDAHGPYASVDQLTKVKGIGKATVEKNRNVIMVKK